MKPSSFMSRACAKTASPSPNLPQALNTSKWLLSSDARTDSSHETPVAKTIRALARPSGRARCRKRCGRKRFTPKALDNIAQGKRAARHPGLRTKNDSKPRRGGIRASVNSIEIVNAKFSCQSLRTEAVHLLQEQSFV